MALAPASLQESASRDRALSQSGKPARVAGFGARDISFIGGLCLMSNNICGSAMAQIPALFQTSGWLPSLICFIAFAVITTASALWVTRAIHSMPKHTRPDDSAATTTPSSTTSTSGGGTSDGGGGGDAARWEFGMLSKTLLPRWAYACTIFFLAASLISQNVSNIIVSSQVRRRARNRPPMPQQLPSAATAASQVMDDILLATAHKTCALTLYPQQSGVSPFVCVSPPATRCAPTNTRIRMLAQKHTHTHTSQVHHQRL